MIMMNQVKYVDAVNMKDLSARNVAGGSDNIFISLVKQEQDLFGFQRVDETFHLLRGRALKTKVIHRTRALRIAKARTFLLTFRSLERGLGR